MKHFYYRLAIVLALVIGVQCYIYGNIAPLATYALGLVVAGGMWREAKAEVDAEK